MLEEKWQVVVTGIDAHTQMDDAVLALIKTFRVTEQIARQLLDGKPHILKKNIDADTAARFGQVLKNMGICARAEPMVAKPALALADNMSLQPIVTPAASVARPLAKKNDSRYNGNRGDVDDEDDDEDSSERRPWLEIPIVRQLGTLLAVVLAIYMVLPRFQNPYTPIGSDPRATAQIRALNDGHEKPETDMGQLRELIESGDYSAAERILRELQDNVSRDISWESEYSRTFENISYKSDFTLPALDRWVEQSGSAVAYMARGAYYMTQGNKERGAKYASATSDEQFTAQGELHAKGVRDVQKALAMDPSMFHGFSLLIMASDSRGISIDPDEVLEQAIATAPAGYYYRYQYLRTRMPKWGGSFEAMKAFTDSQEKYLSENPRIWLLNGFADADRARSAELSKDYRKAVKLYSHALQYGINPDWLTHRAYNLSQIGEYGKALEDVTLSLKYREDSYSRQLQRSLQMQ